MLQDLTSIDPDVKRPDVMTTCPACGQSSFHVSITDGGHYHDAEGIVYTYGGDGHCVACGHAAYHSTSSR